MTIKQRYQAYLAECEKTDAGAVGSVLREHTPTEQVLYDAWQRSLKRSRSRVKYELRT